MKNRIALIVLAVGILIAAQVQASLPVSVIATGCVKTDGIKTETIDFKDGRGPLQGVGILKLEDSDGKPIDLYQFSGQKVEVQGFLLPGDRFVVDVSSLKSLGQCAD